MCPLVASEHRLWCLTDLGPNPELLCVTGRLLPFGGLICQVEESRSTDFLWRGDKAGDRRGLSQGRHLL